MIGVEDGQLEAQRLPNLRGKGSRGAVGGFGGVSPRVAWTGIVL